MLNSNKGMNRHMIILHYHKLGVEKAQKNFSVTVTSDTSWLCCSGISASRYSGLVVGCLSRTLKLPLLWSGMNLTNTLCSVCQRCSASWLGFQHCVTSFCSGTMKLFVLTIFFYRILLLFRSLANAIPLAQGSNIRWCNWFSWLWVRVIWLKLWLSGKHNVALWSQWHCHLT